VESDGPNHFRPCCRFGLRASARAMVLEQKVDQQLAAVAPRRRVQQIGVLLLERQIDEASGTERERGPVELLMGFTDTSERKDRGYFDSIYVRTPAGALFEVTVSKPGGMTVDERIDQLGTSFRSRPRSATAPRSSWPSSSRSDTSYWEVGDWSKGHAPYQLERDRSPQRAGDSPWVLAVCAWYQAIAIGARR